MSRAFNLVQLTEADAAVIKGMLARGDRQSDIAAFFSVNGGRISEINTGKTFHWVSPVDRTSLPPPGPYNYRDAHQTMSV